MPTGQNLSEQFADLLRANAIPINAHLDITYRCDLDCEHCYLDKKNDWPELPTSAWKQVISELSQWGTIRLVWSGGEVFARPDFLELLEFAGQLGFYSVVKTHAGNVDTALAKQLADLGVGKVDVSVYSLTPSVHDAVTRSSGSLERTLRGVAALRSVGIAVRVSVSVFSSNLHELEQMDVFFASMGCVTKMSATLKPDNAGDTKILSLGLTFEERIEFERIQLRLARKGRAAVTVAGPLNQEERPCGIGVSTIYFSPDGAMQPCVVFPREFGHLRKGPIREQWEQSAFRQELQAWTNKDRGACGGCAGAGQCGYCAASAYKITGDYREAPDEFHELTRARVRARELESGVLNGPEFWASIPEGNAAPPVPKRNALFPIYRPAKARQDAGG